VETASNSDVTMYRKWILVPPFPRRLILSDLTANGKLTGILGIKGYKSPQFKVLMGEKYLKDLEQSRSIPIISL